MASKTTPSHLSTAPGPIEQAVAKKYFERGGQMIVHNSHLKVICSILGLALLTQSVALWQLIPLKTIDVITIRPVEGGGGRVIAEAADKSWRPDQDNVSYYLNQWVENTFDVNFSTWRRGVDRASRVVTGAAASQLKIHTRKPEFNSALLISDEPGYVRTVERVSTNFIKDDVALIRFKTISRAKPNAQPVTKTYAMTINFVIQKPKTQSEAMLNPVGVLITSFNYTEEASDETK